MTPTELNNLCISELEAAGLREGKYVAVVGAGPSSPYITSVLQLIEKMTMVCGVQHHPNQSTWDFFESAFRQNQEGYCQVIRQSYDMTPYWFSDVYTHIIAMPFVSFVTLNYDNQLSHAFRKKYPEDYSTRFSVYPVWPKLRVANPNEFHRQNLVAIHGYRENGNQDWPKNIILKTSDYHHHYTSSQTGQRLFSWWQDLLTTYPCLFIGTSLLEPGIDRVVKTLVDEQHPNFRQLSHLHLKDVKPLKVNGVQTEEYPSATKTFGVFQQLHFDPVDVRFTGLLNILSTFSGQPIDDPKPGLPAPEPIAITITNPPGF